MYPFRSSKNIGDDKYMKDSKYLELLRHYIFEKIDDSVEELGESRSDRIIEIVSTVFSAIVSALFAEFFESNNAGKNGSIIVLVIIMSLLFFACRWLIIWIFRHIKYGLEYKTYADGTLSEKDSRRLIASFDNVACDGLILAYDCLNMCNTANDTAMTNSDVTVTNVQSLNMQAYYLFEAFFYYKKTIDILERLLNYEDYCIGTINKVSVYRVKNVFDNISDLKSIFDKKFDSKTKETYPDLADELLRYEKRFNDLLSKIEKI